MEGRLHRYFPKRNLTAFEHASATTHPSNILLFIGGLGDAFLSVPYVAEIVRSLQREKSGGELWTVMEAQLSSTLGGWGTSDLDTDVEEIGECVRFLGALLGGDGGKIVIMGHSTGSQDVLHYLYSSTSDSRATKGPRPPVQGAILQAPVSDRQAILMGLDDQSISEEERVGVREAYERCLALCNTPAPQSSTADDQEHSTTPLPLSLTQRIGFPKAPLSKARFLSLTSPSSPEKPAADDLFSSDLTDSRLAETFGVVGRRGLLQGSTKPSMLVLYSGADEHVPPTLDKEALVARWKRAAEADGKVVLDTRSGVVPGGRHNLGGEKEEQKKGREDGVRRVVEYLASLVDSR